MALSASLKSISSALQSSLAKVPGLQQTSAVNGLIELPEEYAAADLFLPLQGWIVGDQRPGDRLIFRLDGKEIEIYSERVARPDVLAAFGLERQPKLRPGFVAVLPIGQLKNGEHQLALTLARNNAEIPIGVKTFRVKSSPYPHLSQHIFSTLSSERRQKRLEELLPLLRCHACAEALESTPHSLQCSGCRKNYELIDGVPVTIPGTPTYPPRASELDSAISNNPLAPFILDALEAVLKNGGRALEVGSGRKLYGIDGLTQLEICSYPFTDVINQTEELPFRDNSFDLILCLAVTEHVKRPWVLASEIQRVLKPGAKVIADSAFLQPLHGFPSHYFNMTGEALREIFSGVEIESLDPKEHQHPWFSCEAYLRYLLTHVSPEDAEKLQSMSVGELWNETRRFIGGEDTVLKKIGIPSELVRELAAGYTLIGYKR